MIRVLFVCLGNICRSPMAEGVFAHMVQQAALSERIVVDSAGTGHWHVGNPPHHGTRRVLEQRGISYSGRARLLEAEDLDRFDYIIPMDRMNYEDIQALGSGRAEVAPLMSFAPHVGVLEVPDPYMTGRFEDVYDLVDAACSGLLEHIRREHAL